MAKPVIKLLINPLNYQGLVTLATNYLIAMAGNLNFTTPIPALATVSGANDDVIAAIAAWGPVGNRGSHAQLLDLRNKAQILYQLLVASGQYVINTASIAQPTNYANQAAIISTSGLSIKNASTPQGTLGVVQNLHQLFGAKFNAYTPKISWRKPLLLNSKGNVKAYKVLRGDTNDIALAHFLASTTRATYVDTSAARATPYFYFVIAVNAFGDGMPSAGLAVSVPA